MSYQMEEYPETRVIRWEDEKGNNVGECNYTRSDLYHELKKEVAELKMENRVMRGVLRKHNITGNWD